MSSPEDKNQVNIDDRARAQAQGSESGRWDVNRRIDQYRGYVPERRKMTPDEATIEKGYKTYGVLQELMKLVRENQGGLGIKSAFRKLFPDFIDSRINEPLFKADKRLLSVGANQAVANNAGSRPSDFDAKMALSQIPSTSNDPETFQDLGRMYLRDAADAITGMKYSAQNGGVARKDLAFGRPNERLWEIERNAPNAGNINSAALDRPAPPDLTPEQTYVHLPLLNELKYRMSQPDFIEKYKAAEAARLYRMDNGKPPEGGAEKSYLSGIPAPTTKDAIRYYGSSGPGNELDVPALTETDNEMEDWARFASGVKQKVLAAEAAKQKMMEGK